MTDDEDLNLVAREILATQVLTAERVLNETASELLGQLDGEYAEKLKQAMADGAKWLALATGGDREAVDELAAVKARVLLWGWAGKEAARKAWVTALRAWLRQAVEQLADLSVMFLELGLRAMLDAGLNELEELNG